ncbi:MAG: DUF354 domain-containing protein [Promethearchaeota archaeon]
MTLSNENLENIFNGKKIWIDIEQPKAAIMLKTLIKKFEEAGADTFITARDYDSTFKIMDETGFEYKKIGQHGGASLQNKLKTYIERLDLLYKEVINYNPDFLVTFSSVEAPRISFGLQIPSIGFNDEPRNAPVCKLIFPLLDEIITPKCIPIDLYLNLYAKKEQLIRYNGIDEIAWLSEFLPNPNSLKKYNLEKGEYIIVRTEMTYASYFVGKLKPHETIVAKFIPKIYEKHPDKKYFLLTRSKEQQDWLYNFLKERGLNPTKMEKNNEINSNLIVTRYISPIIDLCFFSALVISGGGTIVRESSLLGVPSIECFPGETAPQDIFLIKNGFPMEHIIEPKKIADRAIEILNKAPSKGRYTMAFKNKINQFENPNEVCFQKVAKRLQQNKKK